MADTIDDYIIVEVVNANGIVEANGGECALKGLNTNAVEDNIHTTLR